MTLASTPKLKCAKKRHNLTRADSTSSLTEDSVRELEVIPQRADRQVAGGGKPEQLYRRPRVRPAPCGDGNTTTEGSVDPCVSVR